MRPLRTWASSRLAFFHQACLYNYRRSSSAAPLSYPEPLTPEPSCQTQNSVIANGHVSTRQNPSFWSGTVVSVPRLAAHSQVDSRRASRQENGRALSTSKTDPWAAWLKSWVKRNDTPSEQFLYCAILPLVHQWMRAVTVPSPRELVEVLERANLLRVEHLQKIVLAMLNELINNKAVRDHKTIINIEHEILVLWHHSLNRYNDNGLEPGEQTAQRIHQMASISWPSPGWRETAWNPRSCSTTSGTPQWRLGEAFPNVPAAQLQHHAAIALVIFGYHAGKTVFNISDQNKEAIHFLAHLFHCTDTSLPQQIIQDQLLSNVQTPIAGNTLAAIRDIEAHAMIWKTMERFYPQANRVSLYAYDMLCRSIAISFRTRLKSMDEKGTHGFFKRDWNLAHHTFRVLKKYRECQHMNTISSPRLPAEVYRSFLVSAFNMRSAENAVAVWNFIVSGPTPPSVEDWTTMIHGFAQLRDFDTVEKLWKMMFDSNILPDSVALFVRIRILFKSGRSSKAIQILNDISAAWASTSQLFEKLDGLPHALPTARTFNNAVEAAISNSEELVPELLKWSDSLGIERDTFTFNLLLQMSLRKKDYKTFQMTRHDMILQKVQPNATTYGFCITLALRDEDATVKESFKRVLDLLIEMKEKGIVPTTNPLIPVLQKLVVEEEDVDMARRTLQKLLENLDKAVHVGIYTLLVQCVFKMPQPDRDAIDYILEEIRTSELEPDSGFYNALAQGYANLQDLGRMQEFLIALRRFGMQPTWKTLTACLKACESTSNSTYAMQVLQDSYRAMDRMLIQVDRSLEQEIAQDYRSQFWELALRMGLVK